jgi:hypothetical protein
MVTSLFRTAEEKSQYNFSKQESEVIQSYSGLANDFTWRKNEEEKLTAMQQETSDFYEKNEELLSMLENVKEEKRMETDRISYRFIPIIDALLGLYPALTIVEKEWTAVPILQYPMAIGLIFFFALIGRWTANAIKEDEKKFAYICTAIVPSIYWINYWGFDNGSFIFTLVFSLISGGVQFYVIYFFPRLHNAVAFNTAKKKYQKRVKNVEKQKELLANHTQKFSKQFYGELWQAYHNLHTMFQSHLEKFGSNPNISLSQILLCICNLAFYNYLAIPYREKNGQVEGPSLIVDAPELQELFITGEVRFFGYMLKQSGRNSRLTELIPLTTSISAITEGNTRRQLSEDTTPLEPDDTTLTPANDDSPVSPPADEEPGEDIENESDNNIW